MYLINIYIKFQSRSPYNWTVIKDNLKTKRTGRIFLKEGKVVILIINKYKRRIYRNETSVLIIPFFSMQFGAFQEITETK